MPRRLSIALGAALLCLALPAGAQAETFCVQKPKCVKSGGAARPTLTAAITAAAANGSGMDRIELGPRTYSDGPWIAHFGNPVHIVGAGETKTTLRRAGPGDSQAVLRLEDPASRLERVRVVLGEGANVTGLFSAGRIAEVRVTGQSGQQQTGVSLGTDGLLERSRIVLSGNPSSTGLSVGISAIARDLEIRAPRGVAGGLSVAETRLVRARITSTVVGVHATGNYLLDNVLVHALQGADGVRFVSSAADTTLTLRQSTVVAGKPAGVGVTAIAGPNPQFIFICSEANVVMRSSIVWGFADVLERNAEPYGCAGESRANFDIAWSALNRYDVEEIGGGELLIGPGVTGADPRFVAPTKGNFRLRKGSKLIDRGQPGKPMQGESRVDLDGRKRVIDGDGRGGPRRDIGAYEFKPKKKAKKRKGKRRRR
jgi:hypothetical protein